MPDYKGNDKYMKMMGANKGKKVMKNHGNTQPIKADAQKYDMDRMQYRKMEMKGNNSKAFDYNY